MYDSQKLYTSLKELRVIDEVSLTEAFKKAQLQQLPLGDVLLDENLISDENLGKLIAETLNVPFIHLANIEIPKEILTIVPEVIAKEQNVIAFKKDNRGLHVGMVDPTNAAIVDFLQKKLGMPVVVYLTTERDMAKTQSLYLKDITKAFEDIIQESVQEASKKKGNEFDPPIIKIVETILSYAAQNNASDVHIEPEEKKVLVRFRIDGVLHDIIELSLQIYSQIVTRIKVMAKLRTDEHQVPQDGKITFSNDSQTYDIRVSVVPLRKGEKIVMRLLSSHARQISLLNLGFSQGDLQKTKAAYEKPYGMILSTGPTGSGKTTTMYAILKLLNKREVNIMTIEDPIEYDIEGVNQIQVNPKTDLTFATGLRSILRQDPNVILVGEIRDEETADIAVNAAMTGHLVLSTLHTNDAATAIPRLFDMGIESFLVGSTVNLIIAQRLVRQIHTVCRVSEDVTRDSLMQYLDQVLVEGIFGTQEAIRLYKGKGCSLCHTSGYEGRIGIFEVLVIDDEIRQAIVDKKDAATIRNIAVKNGMKTMIVDGLEKVKQGLTTIEEILRVTKE
ncbi:MAG: type II/IV secretion system protein [Candidatus Levybacteria bacterium]|nr:type II/IV secretion system protein [Candidatus Levybacteria bacterium]